jgi:hypothetical protein
MDVLTNLTSITATSNIVRVKVPTFYRVIWLDAPEHAGTWDYKAYATNGTMIVTGWMTLSAETDPDSHYPIRGNWAFFRAVAPEFPIAHPPFGASEFHSDLTGLYPFSSVLHLFRSPLVADGGFGLYGTVSNGTYLGQWVQDGFAGPIGWGPFEAVKRVPDR